MLSKYLHKLVIEQHDDKLAYEADLNNYLKRSYSGSSVEDLETNGTLGIFYTSIIDGKKCYIKTHQATNLAKKNLEKEAKLFDLVYGKELFCDYFSINSGSGERSFFLLEELDKPSQEISRHDVQELIAENQTRLDAQDLTKIQALFDPNHDSLSYIFEEGSKAIKTLCQEQFLSKELVNEIESLEKPTVEQKTIICHGDLSDKNILQKGSKLFAIDWEDAILGSATYDYLYWLTFFSKRKYYSQTDILKSSEYSNGQARYIMCMIVALKCILSWQAGTWRNDSLSFSKRLEEIIAIK